MQFADLQALMADVFEVAPAAIQPHSTPDDIATWDSLRLLDLLLAIEKHFGVFVSTERPSEMMSAGAILALVADAEKGG